MQDGFKGFSPQSLAFLSRVREENSKEWFDAHRADYKMALLAPFRELVEALGPSMLLIDDMFEIRPAVGKTLSRIHRDTRFSNDKSRYRSTMWLAFKRYKKDWTDAPAYFFELHPDGWRFGLGYYSATRDTMDLFRQAIRDDPEHFLAVADCLGSTFELEGTRYKRPLIKDQEPRLAQWYNCKSFAAIANRTDMGTAFGEELASTLMQGFNQLAPLYRYLMTVEAMKREAKHAP
ncbi:DUF2461 domain-containing protein [Paludibacterium yongneupense]|uniref:DUF2461 domain-containing protein n=1 Tax=Paludibacterium yongneupense TaxID=400061 RepID=UPI0004290A31|nr:DUF2461 domain-containing protein [Paludibacterium yongneupense]